MGFGTLQSEKESVAALDAVANALNVPRTEYFGIINNANQFILKLVLAEGYQAVGAPPPGYVADTGLVVAGKDVAPSTSQSGAIPAGTNVQVTRAKCSVGWRRLVPPYDEGHLDLPDDVAPPGKFFHYVVWTAGQSRAGTPQITAAIRHGDLK